MTDRNSSKRKRGTNSRGASFSEEIRKEVWAKAKIIKNQNADVYREDHCGAKIEWSKYGNTENTLGWEIDHIKPVAKGGQDNLANLQALQWENNRHKADQWPSWECKIPK